MMLFKAERPKAQRVYTVETLNPSKGISQMMHVSKDRKKYAVVLCLGYKTRKTVLSSQWAALEEMEKNRQLYAER